MNFSIRKNKEGTVIFLASKLDLMCLFFKIPKEKQSDINNANVKPLLMTNNANVIPTSEAFH